MDSILGMDERRTNRNWLEKFTPLERYSFGYVLRVLYLLYLVPLYGRILVASMRKYKFLVRLLREHTAELQLARLRRQGAEKFRASNLDHCLTLQELGLQDAEYARLEQLLTQSKRVILGEIDRQGRLLSFFGPIPNFELVTRERFQPRTRFIVRLVALGNVVGIEKSYQERTAAFLNELTILALLAQARCQVPAILDVDLNGRILTTSYIGGRVLRQELVERGARLSTDARSQRSIPNELLPEEAFAMRLSEGKRLLTQVLSKQATQDLFDELRKIHAAGVISNDIKYGNVIYDTRAGKLYWFDFDHAFYEAYAHRLPIRLLRDQDIEKFNAFFGTEHLTAARLRKIIAARRALAPHDWQTPVYFGSGLALGSLWNARRGFGCWEGFLKHHLPAVQGKRILDVYVNNAFYSMQMARRGAEVLALEPSQKFLEQARLVQAGIEWADNACYPVKLVGASPYEIRYAPDSPFDYVTALHGITIADRASAARMVRHIARLGETFILFSGFCLADDELLTPKECARILRDNGFPKVESIDADRNGWRLFIGSKT